MPRSVPRCESDSASVKRTCELPWLRAMACSTRAEGTLAASFKAEMADCKASRYAAPPRAAQLVARDGKELLRRVGRAVLEQAVQQQDVEEAHGLRRDADRHERVEVHQPHLDVLDAALAQGVQRALAGLDAPLGA